MSKSLGVDKPGLRILHDPVATDDSTIVDIVAIHGIGADPDSTWCGRVNTSNEPGREKRFVNWLQDDQMLPSAVLNACIMRYGYPSHWFGEGAFHTKLMDVAKRLLRSLRRHRKANPGRPMIFVCHCYGGLVVLQALLAARSNPSDWPEIFDMTTGLIFLGTPFRGVEGMKQVDMLQAAGLEYSKDQIEAETLQILQPGDEMMTSLVNDFCHARQEQQQVMCFYETRRTIVGRIFGRQDMRNYVVNQSSGCLDPSASSIRDCPLNRDHFNINKFTDPEDDDFVQVKDEVVDMVMKAPRVIRSLRGKSTRQVERVTKRTAGAGREPRYGTVLFFFLPRKVAA